MEQRNEAYEGTTVYVYSIDHSFIRDSCCPAIAVSCYVHGKTDFGAIGFECSEEAQYIRRKIINQRFAYEGKKIKYIEERDAVYFNPKPENIEFTIKAVSQLEGQLCDAPDYFELNNVFSSRMLEMLFGRKLLHKDHKFASDLGLLHVEYGLELQYWPYLTPYESMFYLFGRDREELLQQVKCFFAREGVIHRQLDERHFPIF